MKTDETARPFPDLDHLPASTTPKEDRYHATITAQAARIVELEAALRELADRAERIDILLLEATGSVKDCELGEVVRARALLTRTDAAGGGK